ncbi:RNA polymerase subunit sigma [Anaerovorax odorimutans]|uniref:RNA polymerase sigma factor SigI n=1 Tax=Anaerovorax odorimutans TaxID=109327 RepID=A0ABT1RRX9_9FIRM|nr:sigma factor [Anaerovorax odorimutans]MCQ4637917.1 RNA polymerase subunit sigma [Anaerovorax odorimutans]
MTLTPGEKIELNNLEKLIENHMAFLIRTVSGLTGRYISIENDEEFSIALSAFAEAVERYDPERGNFLTFAKLVIESRLKTYLAKEGSRPRQVSLEQLREEGRDFPEEAEEDKRHLHQEILAYREELLKFGLTLERLADESPRHKDTRAKAIHIADTASRDEATVETTFGKRRLPIRQVARLAKVTEKIVKRSKSFILAAMIIFVKRFPGLMGWIKGTGCLDVL